MGGVRRVTWAYEDFQYCLPHIVSTVVPRGTLRDMGGIENSDTKNFSALCHTPVQCQVSPKKFFSDQSDDLPDCSLTPCPPFVPL
jgi:hypothetical protein